MEGNNGFILIDRGITEHWIWDDDKRFKWWLTLLLMANYEDRATSHDSHEFTLKRGQLLASAGYLATKWRCDIKTVNKFLKKLSDNGMIIREIVHRQTPIITICNYDRYQQRNNASVDTITDTIMDTQMDSIADTITDTQRDTIKRNKRNNSPNGECKTPAHTRKEVSPEEVVDAWNSICKSLPQVKTLTEARKRKIRLRVNEMGTLDKIREIFTRIEASNYCKGEKGWKATFNWIIDNSDNWTKVDEGNYDNSIQAATGNNNSQQIIRNENDPKRSGAVAQSSAEFKRSF